MVAWLESLPLWQMGVIVVGGLALLAALGVFLVRGIDPENFWEHQGVAGAVHALIGVTYAVLLGFVAVGVWERFDAAQAMTFREAGHWQVVYRDSIGVPEGPRIRTLTREYLHSIIKNEWPRMQSADDSSDPQTAALATQLDDAILRVDAKTAAERNAQQDMLANASAALIERNARTTAYEGVNPAVWVVLFAGGMLTIGFGLLFGFRKRWLQYVMICSMAAIIGGALFLTLALDFPFRGEVSVSPAAYRTALQNLDAIDRVRGKP